MLQQELDSLPWKVGLSVRHICRRISPLVPVLAVALQYTLKGNVVVPAQPDVTVSKAFDKKHLNANKNEYYFTKWSALRLYLVKVLLGAHTYSSGHGLNDAMLDKFEKA